MSESSGLGEKGFIFDFLTRNDETENHSVSAGFIFGSTIEGRGTCYMAVVFLPVMTCKITWVLLKDDSRTL